MPNHILKLFNTESRTKKAVVPRHGSVLKMYTCGPTVYDYAHIGNFRTYVFEDLLRRTLKYLGFEVKQVMNLTDVDDKTIKGAVAKEISLEDYTRPYIEAFFDDLQSLMIERVEVYPRATDHISEMVEMIQTLLNKGCAYKGADDSIYFKIATFPRYGRLSHLNLEELKAGASERLAQDEYEKDQISDFVLWKSYDAKRDGQIFWDTSLGRGRPGWHIECSAMALKHLGPELDIHCGGVDNMFPHHENEIAQSECCTNKLFVSHWLHSEHLLVNGRKMSKSLGNFFTLRDLLSKGFTGREVRCLLLQTHYKTQLNFTIEGLEAARSTLRRLDEFIERLTQVKSEHGTGGILRAIEETRDAFTAALADDLNISVALAALFDFIREANGLIDKDEVSSAESRGVLEHLKEMNRVLALLKFESEKLDVPDDVQEALKKRETARLEKNWREADVQRDYIAMQGYLIIDTPEGPKVKKK